jgi:hypothetical protein
VRGHAFEPIVRWEAIASLSLYEEVHAINNTLRRFSKLIISVE